MFIFSNAATFTTSVFNIYALLSNNSEAKCFDIYYYYYPVLVIGLFIIENLTQDFVIIYIGTDSQCFINTKETSAAKNFPSIMSSARFDSYRFRNAVYVGSIVPIVISGNRKHTTMYWRTCHVFFHSWYQYYVRGCICINFKIIS